MPRVKIDRNRCKGCRLCITFCPKKNLKTDTQLNEIGIFPAVVCVAEECTGCGLCYVMCPEACIEIEVESADTDRQDEGRKPA